MPASSAPPLRAATVLPALALFHRSHCPVRRCSLSRCLPLSCSVQGF
ncbi:hypothetical protein Ahy_B06g084535 isoform E [Arachis hypogaea]|uniref:Uncharacterized protein n=1 Tax=Arachis hypogaea TaxID=3818 RepID=A0A444YS58_ARAHY|nr:hypothetical protein Ahy_B06g084535 isoform E [Arachis hypogaea]